MSKKTYHAHILEKLKSACYILMTGHFKDLYKIIATRIYSSNTSVGLLRELNDDLKFPRPKIEVDIRLFKNTDLKAMDDVYKHIRFFKQKISDCYVGITKDNHHCFRTWSMKASENAKIENYFGDFLPLLKPDEAMIEGVYTNPDYRGLRIMPHAINRICDINKSEGINKVIAIVNIKNIASLKGFKRSGFEPYLIRKVKWCFFRRTVTYEPLNDKILQEYNHKTNI